MKTCSKCHIEKPVSEFYKHAGHSDGFKSWCKLCCTADYHASGGSATRIKGRYRLTMKQYRDLISKGCAICGTLENPCIDHDHKCCPTKGKSCGKCIRGVLCDPHNRALGLFNDDVDLLRMAIFYLTGLDNGIETV